MRSGTAGMCDVPAQQRQPWLSLLGGRIVNRSIPGTRGADEEPATPEAACQNTQTPTNFNERDHEQHPKSNSLMAKIIAPQRHSRVESRRHQGRIGGPTFSG
ncbi:hypothetical protein H7H78_12880 [Mycobacterium shinjukuense]|nr:hypothetical protein [Mycobacterium shinjukuense]MCV6986294.1 hypothetical protein [Mycobacterium shinjukuense]